MEIMGFLPSNIDFFPLTIPAGPGGGGDVHRARCPVGIGVVFGEVSGRGTNPTTDLHVNEYVELYHHYPHMSSFFASENK
jgi:hypothetical protein